MLKIRLWEIVNGLGRVLGSIAVFAGGAFAWVVIGFLWFLVVTFHLWQQKQRELWDLMFVERQDY